MILETLKETNSVMLDSIRSTENKQAVMAFKEQLRILGEYTPQLDQLLSIITALKEKKVATSIFTKDIKDSLQTAVDACGEKTNDHSLNSVTVQALKNAIDLCKNTTESAWKEEAESKCSSIIDTLTSLKSLLTDKKEAEDILSKLENAKLSIPASVKDIDSFIKNIDKGKAIIDKLHLDSDVEKFINKVKDQKATVKDLTPHIMKWLKDNKLLNSLKVKF